MGFFVVYMSRRVQVHPRFFSITLQEMLKQRLMLEVEGTFAGRYGYVIAVLRVVEPIPTGELDDSTGYAVFPLKFQAVVFRPFKGEVLDGVVTQVMQYGFFADCGPLSVFVSHFLVPEGMTFHPTLHVWQGTDAADTIEMGCSVRLCIMGTKVEASEISVTGSIKEPYLGRIDDAK